MLHSMGSTSGSGKIAPHLGQKGVPDGVQVTASESTSILQTDYASSRCLGRWQYNPNLEDLNVFMLS
jgi:hypothetical protein